MKDTKTNIPEYKSKRKALNQPLYTYTDLSGVSRNVLHYWKKKGVLDEKRDQEASRQWNYFSALDVVYIGILQRLKLLGILQDHMIGCKEMLFSKEEVLEADGSSNLEYVLITMLTYNHPAYLVISYGEEDINGFYLLDEKEYFAKLKNLELQTYSTILLNDIIKTKLSPIYKMPDFSEYVGLNTEEIMILETIKTKSFINVKIVTRDGKAQTLEGTERIVDPKKIATLMQGDGYETISLKRQNGNTIAAHRTIRKNFKKDK